jgi:hypothetical protein
MRRVKPTVKPDQPERRYLCADMSQRGQLRSYVRLRNELPKIRIKAEYGTPEFRAEVDIAIALRLRTMVVRSTTSTHRSSGARHPKDAHAVTGRQSAVGIAWNDPLDDR